MKYILLLIFTLSFSALAQRKQTIDADCLRIKDGACVTKEELGNLEGSVSPIQAQLDDKSSLADYDYLDGRLDTAELTLDDHESRIVSLEGESTIEQYANLAAFPVTGTDGTLYLAQDTNFLYRWDTSVYVQVGGGGTVDLASGDVTGVLPMANGGSNKALTSTLGGVVYTDNNSMEVLGAGNSEEVLQSNGAAAPTWSKRKISGKSGNSSSVSVEELQTYPNGLTQTATNKYLIDCANGNLLENCSFEHSTFSTGWTLTAGSSANTGSVIHGSKAARLTMTAQALNWYQDSTLYQAQLTDGVSGSLSVWIKTTVSGIYVSPRNAGTTDTSLLLEVSNDGKYHEYVIPEFILRGTSNGIAIHSNGVSVTGDIDVDNAVVKIGSAGVNAQYVTAQSNSYNGTQAALTNSTFETHGSGIYTANTTGVITFLQDAYVSTTFTMSVPTSTANDQINITASTGQIHNTFKRSTETNSNRYTTSMSKKFVKGETITYSTANLTGTSTITISAIAIGDTTVYSSNNLDSGWEDCGHTTSDFAGFGTVSGISLQCKKDRGDLLMKGKFTSGTSTAVEARVNLKFRGSTLTSKNSSIIPSIQMAGHQATSVSASNYFWSAMLIEPSVTYLTIGHQQATTAPLTKALGTSYASGNIISFTARIPIDGWSDSNVVVATVKETTKIPGSTNPVEFIANIDCDSGATIPYFNGASSASISNISSGVCNITVPSTTFKTYSDVVCTGAYKGALGSGNIRNLGIEMTSATNIAVDCVQPSADCTSYTAGISCKGEGI